MSADSNIAPGTYYHKDWSVLRPTSKAYILILDGVRVGEVKTRKEAEAWFRAQGETR